MSADVTDGRQRPELGGAGVCVCVCGAVKSVFSANMVYVCFTRVTKMNGWIFIVQSGLEP